MNRYRAIAHVRSVGNLRANLQIQPRRVEFKLLHDDTPASIALLICNTLGPLISHLPGTATSSIVIAPLVKTPLRAVTHPTLRGCCTLTPCYHWSKHLQPCTTPHRTACPEPWPSPFDAPYSLHGAPLNPAISLDGVP